MQINDMGKQKFENLRDSLIHRKDIETIRSSPRIFIFRFKAKKTYDIVINVKIRRKEDYITAIKFINQFM